MSIPLWRQNHNVRKIDQIQKGNKIMSPTLVTEGNDVNQAISTLLPHSSPGVLPHILGQMFGAGAERTEVGVFILSPTDFRVNTSVSPDTQHIFDMFISCVRRQSLTVCIFTLTFQSVFTVI